MSERADELDAVIQAWAEYHGVQFSAEAGVALRAAILTNAGLSARRQNDELEALIADNASLMDSLNKESAARCDLEDRLSASGQNMTDEQIEEIFTEQFTGRTWKSLNLRDMLAFARTLQRVEL